MERRDFIKATVAAELAIVTGVSLEDCKGKTSKKDSQGKSVREVDPKKFYEKIDPKKLFEFEEVGTLTLMFICDSHAHLRPIYYREPSVNLAPANMASTPGHLSGEKGIKYWFNEPNAEQVYYLSDVDFNELSKEYGRMGGFANLATLANQVRAERKKENCLFLDVGDTWQGTAIGLWTDGNALVEAQKLLEIDVMTPHWEFTFGVETLQKNIKSLEKANCEFLAQNVIWKEASEKNMLNNRQGRVFKPYTIKERGGVKIGIIGQGFPYVPIAHPKNLNDYNKSVSISEDWSFGIRQDDFPELIRKLREDEKVDLVVFQSHNGIEVDKKIASTIDGIDIIIGGHTHDPLPKAIEIKGKKRTIQKALAPQALEIGGTLLIQAGSHGKFLGRIDLEIKDKKIVKYNHKLYPVIANPKFIKEDPKMKKLIDDQHKPYEKKLGEKLAITDGLLYRRDTMCGTFDRLIVEAIKAEYDSEVVFSPGFRWGPTLLPGNVITVKDVYDLTAITYATVWTYDLTGEMLRNILADILDNVFNRDAYLQQGGDFSRLYGVDLVLKINIPPDANILKRIVDMKIAGKKLDLKRNYKVSIWGGTTNPKIVNNLRKSPKPRPAYEVVADYLRQTKKVKIPVPDYIKYV